MLLLLVVVILAVVARVMTAKERTRAVAASLDFARRLREASARVQTCEPFRSNLRARTPTVFVTPALVAAMCVVFIAGNASDLGNIGPRTTDGEWWRVATAIVVHSEALHLAVSLLGFLQPALLLERLAGHFALGAVFAAAGIASGVRALSEHPIDMHVGASGAVFGVYGLLIVAIVTGAVRRSPARVPLLAIRRMAPAAAVFVLYHVGTGRFESAEAIGFITGAGCGMLLAIGIGEHKPPMRRIVAAMSATAILTIASAAAVGDIVDVRPEIAQVVALEARTAGAYAAAVDRFHKGRVKVEALASVIEQTIVPELEAAADRLSALAGVTAQQQPLVAHAEEYLRLRQESWRLRREALRTTDLRQLRQAERIERESLGALQRITPATAPPIL